jgi:flagellar basal-body rod protein FlgF
MNGLARVLAQPVINTRTGPMIHGIYLSSHGANAQSLRQDVIANNLANASTTGFKRDVATFRVFKPEDINKNIPTRMDGNRQKEVGAIAVDRVLTDHTSAALQKTGQPYDICLSGEGFLRVSDGQNEFLTRNGQLHRSIDGELVTLDQGLRVLDTCGEPIEIPITATGIDISTDGSVSAVMADNQRIKLARMDLVLAPTNELRKFGNSLYETQAELSPAGRDLQVRQGFVEASGVNPIQEMTAMIETSRAFEANINMIRLQDESLGRLLQTVGG